MGAGFDHQWMQQKATFIRPVHSLPRPNIPSHMVTCPLKPDCFVSTGRFIGLLARNIALLRFLLTVRLLMRPLPSHRLRSVCAVMNRCYLVSLVRNPSSLRVVCIGLPVLCCSFTLLVWFTHCFNRIMTECLTLHRCAVCLYDIPPLIIPTACHLSASDSFPSTRLK
jgi:hypothetical protein